MTCDACMHAAKQSYEPMVKENKKMRLKEATTQTLQTIFRWIDVLLHMEEGINLEGLDEDL